MGGVRLYSTWYSIGCGEGGIISEMVRVGRVEEETRVLVARPLFLDVLLEVFDLT